MNWKDLVIAPETNMKNVLERLNETQKSILFVMNQEQKLMGSITDGDIRRFLLAGGQQTATASEFMNRSPVYEHSSSNLNEVRRILMKLGLDAIPLVNEEGIIENIYHPEVIKSDIGLNFVGLLMAGGKGERLLPLTLEVPKPLLRVGNRALIEHQIDRLVECGIKKIYISVCYLAEKIISYVGDGSRYDIEIEYIVEEQPLGTAGSISMINDEDRESHIIVCNTDLIHRIDFQDLANFHYFNNSDLTLASSTHKVSIPFGMIKFDENCVKEFLEKPTLDVVVFSGIVVVAPKIQKALEKAKRIDMSQLIMDSIKKEAKVLHYLQSTNWLDVGSHESLNQAIDAFRA